MPRRDPWVYIGLFAFFALLFVALFGERIAPHETIYFVIEHGRDPRPYDPGVVFPLGSDVLGRDLLSLVLAGAGTTLLIIVLAGLARVAAALAIGAVAGWWSAARRLADASAELVAAVPATIVALVVVKVFVRGDATFLVFVGALLLTGWAGPYRVVRSELDRLGHMGFTESAAAIGAGKLHVFLHHHVPHLVPLLAVNITQQSVASLVAMAELGVLGVFVGASRFINVEESMSFVRTGQTNGAPIAEPPEWGGLLANARSIESLWSTRFLFLVPGVAFALAAVAIAAVGVAVARHYARRNLLQDLQGRGARAFALVCAVFMLVALVLPDRYAAALSWADAARAAVTTDTDVSLIFAHAGLKQIGSTWDVTRDVEQIQRAAPASISVGDVTLRETPQGTVDIRSMVYSDSGGGKVEAPLAFLSWGISPSDTPPQPARLFDIDFGTTVKNFPDDYARVDVRGKIAVVMRYTGIMTGRGAVTAPDVTAQVKSALKRGAVGVIVVDSRLPLFPRLTTGTQVNLYQRVEADSPVQQTDGVPVVVVSAAAADRLLKPFGITPTDIYMELAGVQTFTPGAQPVLTPWIASDSEFADRSIARDVAARAVMDVPLARVRAHVRSVMAESDAPASTPRILVWGVTHPTSAGGDEPVSALAAAATAIGPRGGPFVFVAFDPSVDATGNARMVAERLGSRKIGFVIVLDDLVGAALSFRTAFGDLVPAFDHYADEAGVPHLVTRGTVSRASELWTWPGIAPFIDDRSIVVTGDQRTGDLRGAAAALIGYIAGRAALGAEELPR